EGYVKQLALALGKAARKLVAFAGKPELGEHGVSFGRHGAVPLSECRQVPRLAVAREDRQRHIVEGTEIVEQVHQLKAARDARLDALGHGVSCDTVASEDKHAGVDGVAPSYHVPDPRL